MSKLIGLAVFALMGAELMWAAEPATICPHPWEKVEIVLTAAKDYPNPYVDVAVWVELSGPGFTKRCYGFWDGGRTFRVRVVATGPGQWTWRSGSNQDDPGLSGKTGSFTATAWTQQEKKENPVRRGFVRATPNGHALQYADGTPYFIVGDYMYAASTWRYKWRDEDTDYPVNTDQGGFKDWVTSINGYVIDGRVHAHVTLADPDKAFGGHLEPGTTVFTFAVVTLGVCGDGVDMSRVDDKAYR
jgi:hypothetical protein